jgi:DNA-binding CsgD family transcriptional regulator
MSDVATTLPSAQGADNAPLSIERSRAAREIGAAIAHQLNGPLTALLLYVNDLHINSDRFLDDGRRGASLKQIAEKALQEVERACALIQQISDASVAAAPDEAAIIRGRDVIAWWSRTAPGASGRHAPATDDKTLEDRAIEANSHDHVLTRREREVLKLVAQGLTNKEGALRLSIGPRTFESHRARIMRKFKAKNAADLVRMALQTGTPADGHEAKTDCTS